MRHSPSVLAVLFMLAACSDTTGALDRPVTCGQRQPCAAGFVCNVNLGQCEPASMPGPDLSVPPGMQDLSSSPPDLAAAGDMVCAPMVGGCAVPAGGSGPGCSPASGSYCRQPTGCHPAGGYISFKGCEPPSSICTRLGSAYIAQVRWTRVTVMMGREASNGQPCLCASHFDPNESIECLTCCP